jgi:hypothetical protein
MADACNQGGATTRINIEKALADKFTHERSREMDKTLAQLERKKQLIEDQIKEFKRTQREARKTLAFKTLDAMGIFELDEKELVEQLKSLKRRETKQETKNV